MSLIVVEGLIGCGKSTLSKALSERIPNSRLFEEPVESNPYLADFYKDKKRWGLEMQFWLFTRRYQMHREAIQHIWKTSCTCIFDRSLYGDAVFEKHLYLSGDITYAGHMNYRAFRDTILRAEGQLHPHKMIFLQVTPEECYRRIKEVRRRQCESEIPLEYLKGLNNLYQELNREMRELGTDVIEVDWEKYGDVDEIMKRLALSGDWEGWRK